MKTVYLVRHAKSSWEHADLSDIERPLNERGLMDAPFMAKLLHSRGVGPDAMMASPAIRALTTAAYFKMELGVEGEDFLVRDEIYEAMPGTIVQLITMLPESFGTVMLFGHNPTFTDVANLFTKNHIASIPTCGVVCIRSGAEHWVDFSPKNAEVADYFFPKQYQ